MSTCMHVCYICLRVCMYGICIYMYVYACVLHMSTCMHVRYMHIRVCMYSPCVYVYVSGLLKTQICPSSQIFLSSPLLGRTSAEFGFSQDHVRPIKCTRGHAKMCLFRSINPYSKVYCVYIYRTYRLNRLASCKPVVFFLLRPHWCACA